ncbi:MAG: type II secretion system protein [Kiritimatiellae bacterium]|nr:type II secretion system protein [Kiritimatiellia bacterium]
MRCRHIDRGSGFTLVEIMIVVAIIGLLTTIAVPAFMKARSQSQTNACINNLRQMAAAKEMAAFANLWGNNDGPGTIGNPLYRNTCSTYIKGGKRPMCPTGSQCFYNALNTDPTCESGIVTHIAP